jgi:hypothetical protein
MIAAVVVEGQIPFGMTPERQLQKQQQISPLRCEMTNKRTGNGDCRSPLGMTTRKATAAATADFSGSLRNDKQKDWLGVRLGVPKGDCSGTGMVTELGFGEDFVGFAWWRSSILGIAGMCVMRMSYVFG